MTKSKESTVTETLSRVGDVLTEKPIVRQVPIRPKNNFERFLMNIRLISNKRILTIYPISPGNVIRVASKVILIPDDILNQDVIKILFNGSYEHGDKLIYIAACAIQNDENEPTEELVKFLKYKTSNKIISEILDDVFFQLDTQSFIKSIILMRGLNVLNVPEQDVQNAKVPD